MNEILTNVVNKAIATLDHIKSAIIRNGVDVPEGSSTATYADKISEVFEAGIDSVAPDIEEQTTRLNNGLAGSNSEAQTMREKIYEDGFEAGKKSEYDAFWDAFQENGTRTGYDCAFKRWTNENFYPKYDIKPVDYNAGMFQHCLVTNIKERLESLDVILDTSQCTNLQQAFQETRSAELPYIDASQTTTLSYTFASDSYVSLHVKLPENVNFNGTFHYCRKLVDLTMDNNICLSGLTLSWSPLNKTSLTSIVNALSTTATGLTVTLRLDAVNKAFETSEGAADGSTSDEWLTLVATKSNWTISLINS